MLKLPLDNLRRVRRIIKGNIIKIIPFPYGGFLSWCEVKLFDTRYNTYCLYFLDMNMGCLVGIYYIDDKVVTNLYVCDGKIIYRNTNNNDDMLYADGLIPQKSKFTEVRTTEFCTSNWTDINDSLVNLSDSKRSEYLVYLKKVLLEYNLLNIYTDLKRNLIGKQKITPLSYELSKNILDIIGETIIEIERLNKEYPYHLLARN